MPLIEILGDIGPSLIVKWPVGFAYFNQTGGHSCQQSWAEGILVPIPAPSSSLEDSLYELFGPASKYGGACTDGIDQDDADRIDALLAWHLPTLQADRIDILNETLPAFRGDKIVRVDRDRLDDSWEAWVHVRIGVHPKAPNALGAPPWSEENSFFWPFFGLPSDQAILTWTNSD